MDPNGDSIPEEVIELSYHYLPPARLAEVDAVLKALQDRTALEFLLAIFEVQWNGRALSAATPPGRSVLNKLLQALDQEEGMDLLYSSPYNDLGRPDKPPLRHEWWNFDLADQLCTFQDLRSIRIFLEYGTGTSPGHSAEAARLLHDRLLRALVGDSKNYGIWACADIRGVAGDRPAMSCGEGEGVWPASEVSPWFRGVFWDDLVFLLNPPESTLTVLAITDG
jgi:hypothetical protein